MSRRGNKRAKPHVTPSLLKSGEPFKARSKALRLKLASQRKWLREHGFIHSHLWFGTTVNRVTHERLYKHLVIFKATPWTAIEIVRMDSFFRRHIPKNDLGVYVIYKEKLLMLP